MIAHRATLDVSRDLVLHLSRSLGAERRLCSTPQGSRALTPFWQTVLVLRWFCGQTDIPGLGRDHRVSRAIAYRYVDEGIDVLADQAPDLHAVLDQARADGHAYLIMDGTLIPADRCSEQTISVKGEPSDLWYSGKAHQHASNIQACPPRPACHCEYPTSNPAPSTTSPPPAPTCSALSTPQWPTACPLSPTGGYEGAGIGVLTPVKTPSDGQALSIGCTYNRLLRCLGERGFALLKGRWRTLQYITVSPSRIGDITRAALVLTHFEYGHLPGIR